GKGSPCIIKLVQIKERHIPPKRHGRALNRIGIGKPQGQLICQGLIELPRNNKRQHTSHKDVGLQNNSARIPNVKLPYTNDSKNSRYHTYSSLAPELLAFSLMSTFASERTAIHSFSIFSTSISRLS